MNMFQRQKFEKRQRIRRIRNYALGCVIFGALVWSGFFLFHSQDMYSTKPVRPVREAATGKVNIRRDVPVKKLVDKVKSAEVRKNPVKKQPPVVEDKKPAEKSEIVAELWMGRDCTGEKMEIKQEAGSNFNLCGGLEDKVKSMRVRRGELDAYEGCGGSGKYWGSVMPVDDCVNNWGWPPLKSFKFAEDSIAALEKKTDDNNGKGKYVVAFSCESSTYFGYQVQANYLGFKKSGQDRDARFIRLLTSSSMDDMGEDIPSFNAKRHLYKMRYGPLNKPDVITKWYESVNAPKEEIVVIIDPDNWLRKSVRPWVDRAEKGHGVAQASFFAGATQMVTRMYKEFCGSQPDADCDWPLKMAAVPYILHRDDMKAVAPLWKKYTLLIKEKIEVEKSFEQRYGGVQVGWCAEMFAFIFGCAEAKVKITIVHDLQIRDVGAPMTQSAKYPMIHMGRAWFPWEYKPGAKWTHTEGRDFRSHGRQVWCKCNDTASDVRPWPLPANIDLVSEVTLTLLHEAYETYGEIPPSKFRPNNYHDAYA